MTDLLKQYEEQGYVVAEGLLDPATDLKPVMDEYASLIDQIAREMIEKGNDINYDFREPVLVRMLNIMRETKGSCHQHLDITLPLENISEDSPLHTGQAVFDLLRNKKLLDAVELLVGDEVYSCPVQHTRIKPPERYIPESNRTVLTAKTFWHQDLGVIAEEADDSNVISAFIAMNDMDIENGCVLVVPGSHKRGLLHHCRSGNMNGIPEELVGADRVPVPMKAGDVLFLNKYTIHASLPNESNSVRWSFDLRYLPTGQPTGRPWFPGFVARSKNKPETALSDHIAWSNSWKQARSILAKQATPKFARWGPPIVCEYCAEAATPTVVTPSATHSPDLQPQPL